MGREKTSKRLKVSARFKKNLYISCVLLTVTFALLFIWFLLRPSNKSEQYDLFNTDVISELTTLKCRYHNVSVSDIEGDLLGIGRKYVWFEYDVIVEVGIDTNEVSIQEPTEDGVVKVYIPPAKILGVTEDKTTIFKPVCELGPFTQLTAEEERQIISDGINKLKKDAKTQEVIFQAYNSAKKIYEKYIINMGKLIGENYTVEWIEESNNTPQQENPVTE